MSFLFALVAGVFAGAFVAWRVAGIRTTAIVARMREETRREIAYWADAAERARAEADRVAGEAAARLDGWRQGTADVISVMPRMRSPQDNQQAITDSGRPGG